MIEAVANARVSLKGVMTGSPRRKFATMLPAKHTSMDDNQLDRGCFLWNETACWPAAWAVKHKHNIFFVKIHCHWIEGCFNSFATYPVCLYCSQ